MRMKTWTVSLVSDFCRVEDLGSSSYINISFSVVNPSMRTNAIETPTIREAVPVDHFLSNSLPYGCESLSSLILFSRSGDFGKS